jgi:hypothetical protein
LLTLQTLRACRTGIAGIAFVALGTLEPHQAYFALRALLTLRTCRSYRSGITGVAFITLWTLRPRLTLWTWIALRALLTLRTLWTCIAGIALGALRTHVTLRALSPYRSLCTFWALRACRSRFARRRMKGVRHGRHLLPRAQSYEITDIIAITRPDAYLQPAGIPIEYLTTEIQLHCKMAVHHLEVIRHNDCSQRTAEDARVIVQPEVEVIEAVRGGVGVNELPLVGESRA